MAVNNNSFQSPRSDEQVPQQMSIGIENLLHPNMPEPQPSPSSVAGDPGSDKRLWEFYWFDVDALETWAEDTRIGFSVEEPKVTKISENSLNYCMGKFGNPECCG